MKKKRERHILYRLSNGTHTRTYYINRSKNTNRKKQSFVCWSLANNYYYKFSIAIKSEK